MVADEVIGWFEARGQRRRHRAGRVEGIAGVSTESTRPSGRVEGGDSLDVGVPRRRGIVGAVGDCAMRRCDLRDGPGQVDLPRFELPEVTGQPHP